MENPPKRVSMTPVLAARVPISDAERPSRMPPQMFTPIPIPWNPRNASSLVNP
jgi:hypothetical protein